MKGLELPINMIVVIAIAVLVLVVISAFFVSNFTGNTSQLDLEGALVSGCSNLRALYECKPSNVNDVIIPRYNPGGIKDPKCNLAYICDKKGATNAEQCAQLCGCPIYEPDTSSLNPKCA